VPIVDTRKLPVYRSVDVPWLTNRRLKPMFVIG